MTAYPTSFPQEALLTMLDKVRGREVETSKLVHAAWVVVGYGLGQTLGADEKSPVWGEAPELDDEAAGDLIEAALLSHDTEASPEAKGAIGWVILVKIAANLLLKYAL